MEDAAKLNPLNACLKRMSNILADKGATRVRTICHPNRQSIYLAVSEEKWDSVAQAPPNHCPGWLPHLYRAVHDGLSEWMAKPESPVWAPNRPLALALTNQPLASPFTPYLCLPDWLKTASKWHVGTPVLELLVLPGFTCEYLAGKTVGQALCATRLGGDSTDAILGLRLQVLDDLDPQRST